MLIMRRLQKRSNFRENQSKTSVRGKESILVSGKLSLYKTNETDRQKRGSFFVVLPQIFISIKSYFVDYSEIFSLRLFISHRFTLIYTDA